MKTYFVYLLKCSDSSYYTGVTNSVERRLKEHNEGTDPFCYTFKRRPLELVFLQDFREVKEAIAFEKQVKGWSRKKKEAMINGDWNQLKSLAECRNGTSHRNHFTRVESNLAEENRDGGGGFDSAQPDTDTAQSDIDSTKKM